MQTKRSPLSDGPGSPRPGERRRRPAGPATPPLWITAGLVLALLVAIAALLDARRCARAPSEAAFDTADDLARLADPSQRMRFTDPRGLFRVDAPHGWAVTVWPQTRDFNVRFRSPHGPMLTFTAVPVDYREFSRLLRHIEDIQERLGLDMHIEPTTFQDRPAIRRRTRLHHDTVIMIDFLEEAVAHHLQISIPHGLVEAYEDLLWQWLERYEPLSGREEGAARAESDS